MILAKVVGDNLEVIFEKSKFGNEVKVVKLEIFDNAPLTNLTLGNAVTTSFIVLKTSVGEAQVGMGLNGEEVEETKVKKLPVDVEDNLTAFDPS